jgi:hypothetical protein
MEHLVQDRGVTSLGWLDARLMADIAATDRSRWVSIERPHRMTELLLHILAALILKREQLPTA